MTAPAHGMPPLAAGAVAAPEGAASADLAWSAVLMRFVDDQGRVDFRGLAADGHDLDTVVARIAAPDAVPAATDRPALLAFRINSYNALAMRHVVSRGLPRRLSLLGRLGFFVLSRVVVAGRSTSLYDYETDTIRPMDDERVHFALNCMSVSCPRLPRVPFRPEALEEALDRAARQFFAEPRNVQVDDLRHVLRLSSILSFYKADFLARAPTLADYVNRYRTEPVPENYRVEFIPYDWTINSQP